ncbi:uncharacterized protein At4g06744-like [Zingiber officinale]|uniref:Uncharacterized protein n=1 Tax=Zingiber officinale TaxID=94328 RepID=A0A8J5F445_ZINOF|nr:uncharacterized protein At4g06744-like [Zingiber officinale]KAG6482142.1 hypothetical protein ZIOFF_058773 [Zingiber officinale]
MEDRRRSRHLLLLQLLCFLCWFLFPCSGSNGNREAIEIGIGIGIGGSPGIVIGGSPEPPHSPSSPSRSSPPPPHSSTSPPHRSPPLPHPSSCSNRSPPPKPLRELQPCDFANILQYRAYKVIQKFLSTITCDPYNITATWVGAQICSKGNTGYCGFYCEGPPDKRNMPTVASVDFNGYYLEAKTVRGFIDQLPDLAIFHANSNRFGDTVPNLTQLPFFYEIDVSNNLQTGCFPNNVLSLVNLSFLDLRYNGYSGQVPPSVFDIQTQVLFLNNNKFNGEIPANLGKTPANYITFAYNDFTGPIPRSIGQACNTLLEILFLGNRLSGCLPYEIGLLRNATVFDAGSNQLTGPIPLSFGCLKKVEQLNLAGNMLSGEVPDSVCRLANSKYGRLVNLSLSGNYFTSVGPSCVGLIGCNVLDVKGNCISGMPGQRPAQDCARFQKQAKPVCPTAQYVPCSLPEEELSLEKEGEEARDKAPTVAGYSTYKALRPPEGKKKP